MKELQLKIKMIELLIEANENDKVVFTRTFVSKTGSTEKQVKDILVNLKKNGMVELDWCYIEDGGFGGRGYVLTTRATQWSIREWLDELKKIESEEKL